MQIHTEQIQMAPKHDYVMVRWANFTTLNFYAPGTQDAEVTK